jgi:hypothetical protein
MIRSIRDARVSILEARAHDLDLSNDGTRLAIAGPDGVEVRRIADGAVEQRISSVIGWGVAFMGRRIAYTAQGVRGRYELYLGDRALLAYGFARAQTLARDRAGKRLAVGGSALQLWDVAPLRCRDEVPAAQRSGHVRAALSPDGARVYAYGVAEGEIVRYGVAKMRETGRFAAPRPFAAQVAVSPDERWLAAVGRGWNGLALHDLKRGRRIAVDENEVFRFDVEARGKPLLFTHDSRALVTFAARPTLFTLPALRRAPLAEPILAPGTLCDTATSAYDAPVVAFGCSEERKIVVLELRS